MIERMTRRAFVSAAAFAPAVARSLRVLAQEPARAARPLRLAEWSYRWIGVERAELYRGTVISGRQMYVESWVPAQLRHPYPVVLVHEPGAQGSEWISTPSGGPGWLTYLLEEGYAVHVVDLPALGRVPYDPELHGPFGQAPTYERAAFAGNAAAMDQFMAARGPSPAGGARAAEVWRSRAGLLLDALGPSVIVAHGDSAPFAWAAASARPVLVRGMAAIEPRDAVMTTAAARAFATATFIVRGRDASPMLAADNRAPVQPLLEWLDRRAPATRLAPPASRSGEGTAVDLADYGSFWVGIERKATPYGTVAAGQTYVQYMVPSRKRHPHPIVLVHGGGGQGTHWMGDGAGGPGWAHYYLQQGYAVYVIDCPGYGRSPEHPDATGVSGPLPTIEATSAEIKRAVDNPQPQWPGTGEVGDPDLDRFLAGQAGVLQRDLPVVHGWWATAAEQLLDRIGPAIIQAHTDGGAFGWIAADRRPSLVKAIVCTVIAEADAPLSDRLPWGLTAIPVAYDPPVRSPAEIRAMPRTLKNLAGIPILIVSGEYDGRAQAPAVAGFFRQFGCQAEHMRLQDRGVHGNGALVMLEANRREVFEVIRAWIDSKADST